MACVSAGCGLCVLGLLNPETLKSELLKSLLASDFEISVELSVLAGSRSKSIAKMKTIFLFFFPQRESAFCFQKY